MIPCYNEVDCIERAYLEIRAELARYGDVEMLFVDDGSTDGTLGYIKEFAAQDPCVRYLAFTRNFGLEAAFSAGFKYAGKRWTVQFDADLQSPPAGMHRLVARALEGYDVVFGVRDHRQDPWLRRWGSSGLQLIARTFFGITLPAGASVFRIARTSVARRIVELRLGTPYFIATVPLVGARYATVSTPHQARQGGSGKWTWRKLVAHGTDLLAGYSLRPIALVYLLAAAGAALGAGALALAATGRAGPSSLAAVSLVGTTVALVALGVLARYLVRVIRSQDGVPPFLIRESNFPVDPADSLYAGEPSPAYGDHRRTKVA